MAKVTSIQLDDDLAARLDQLAAALDRPRAWVIAQAIARYVDEEAREVAAIAEASPSIEAAAHGSSLMTRS